MSATTIKAKVIDAGGGEIRLLVDRRTETYPDDGTEVLVIWLHKHDEDEL